MLTEASAAVSLPYINSEHQKIYVWFLIIFPSFLITLFFLTLNFNNKSLYTPTDLSKAEHTPRATELHPEAPASFKHTTPPIPLSTLRYQASINFSARTPQRFIFLPRGHRVHDPDPPSTPVTLSTESLVLIEGTQPTKLYFIDLSHERSQRPDKYTLENTLRTHLNMSRNNKNNMTEKDVLLLLVNTQSQLDMVKHFVRNACTGHTQVIAYNRDTRKLDTLNSPWWARHAWLISKKKPRPMAGAFLQAARIRKTCGLCLQQCACAMHSTW